MAIMQLCEDGFDFSEAVAGARMVVLLSQTPRSSTVTQAAVKSFA